jgi:CcmD family protein
MEGNLLWLFAAFAAAWVLVFAYLIHIARHEQRLRRRVEALEAMLIRE